MGRSVQIFNPVHLQKIKTAKLTVMGRVLNGKRQQVSVFLNNFLVRKVTPSPNGGFECRIDMTELSESQHVVEIRIISGFGTERVMIPFIKAPKPKTSVTCSDAAREQEACLDDNIQL